MTYLLIILSILIAVPLIRLLLEIRKASYASEVFSDGKVGEGLFLFNSWFAKVFLPKNYVAITIGKLIFVRGKFLPQETITHELRHTVQWKELGFFNFLRQYLTENKTVGYQCNRFEEEARRFAGQPTRCS